MVDPIAIVGLVDACISITTTIIRIGQAAKDANGLPKELVKLFDQLPVVSHSFAKAKETVGKLNDESRVNTLRFWKSAKRLCRN